MSSQSSEVRSSSIWKTAIPRKRRLSWFHPLNDAAVRRERSDASKSQRVDIGRRIGADEVFIAFTKQLASANANLLQFLAGATSCLNAARASLLDSSSSANNYSRQAFEERITAALEDAWAERRKVFKQEITSELIRTLQTRDLNSFLDGAVTGAATLGLWPQMWLEISSAIKLCLLDGIKFWQGPTEQTSRVAKDGYLLAWLRHIIGFHVKHWCVLSLDSASVFDEEIEGLEYFLLEQVYETLEARIFDLLSDWEGSQDDLLDLKFCCSSLGWRARLSGVVEDTINKRLLHVGAQTQDVVGFYINAVCALRILDPSLVILSRIVPLIRRHLRQRPNTVEIIVAALLGSNPLHRYLIEELEKGDSENGGLLSLSIREDLGEGETDEGEDFDLVEDFADPYWSPRPAEAGRSYTQAKQGDVVEMLVSIFTDRAGFITAVEGNLAGQLLRSKGYDVTKEYRKNITLKRRFGTSSLGKCDVMLSDLASSRRLDLSIKSLLLSPLDARSPSKVIGDLPAPGTISPTLHALHPIVTSRQFWPQIGAAQEQGEAAAPSDDSDNAHRTHVHSSMELPGHVTARLTMPGRYSQAMEFYSVAFSQVKDTRKLRWLGGLGSVTLHIAMDDGRIIEGDFLPIQAAVLELIQTKNGSDGLILASEAAKALGVHEAHVLESLYFWASRSVLCEVVGSPGLFRIVEHA